MGFDPVSLGATIALNAASMALTASQVFEGPRLDSLGVTTSDYGAPINYAYGTKRLFGVSCIWAESLTEIKQQNKTKGGKYNEYKYFGTWAVMMTDHEIDAVRRIWFDKHLVYDVSGAGPVSPIGLEGNLLDYMRIYTGTTTQEPDPRIQATIDALHGEGSTPAYRGRSYIVFEDVPLEKLGNRLPQVDVEVVAVASDAFPRELFDTNVDADDVIGFSSDHTRLTVVGNDNTYGIWDVASRSLMISGTLDQTYNNVISSGSTPQEGLATSDTGELYALTYHSGVFTYQVVKWPADGVGAATLIYASIFCPNFVQWFRYGSQQFLGVSMCLTESGGYWIDITADVPIVTYIDPTAHLGVDARVKSFCQDLDGEVWAVCMGEGLAATEVGFIKMTGVPTGHVVTLTGSVGSSDAETFAYHYRDADVDHFVVGREFTTPGWSLVDRDTWTETASASISLGTNIAYPWTNIRPGARYWYEASFKVDSKDLTVTSWNLSDWGGGGSSTGLEVYDEINHAIIKRYSATQIGWFYLDRISGSGVTLQSIVEDVAERCGLVVANDIDATALDQTVDGYSWVQGQGKAILEPLLEYHNSEVRLHDFELEFIKRGGTSTTVITADEMVPESGKRYHITRTLDTDLPRGINVNFADPDMDQQPNSARSQRYADATDGRREQSLDVTTLVADIDDARSAADGYLRRTWFSQEGYELALTREHTAVEPGDIRILVLDDVTRVAKCKELEFGANGVLTGRWVRDGTAPHIASNSPASTTTQHVPQTQPGAPADGYVPPVILTPAYVRGFVMDIPLILDSHEALITYMAAGPYSDDAVFSGATIYESTDAGANFAVADAVTSAQQITWGVTTDVLPDALSTVWDRASSLNVRIQSGTLTSVTEAEAENGSNMALIGDELVHFTTATLEADGTYTLSGFLRGRRGTEQHTDAHAVGDRFVLMTAANLVRHAMGVSDLTDDFVYRPVPAGSINIVGFDQDLEFSGASLKPYSPAHLSVADSAGDKVITWVRRTRLGGFNVYGTTPPLGESTEAYVVQILDGGGSVIRTISGLTSPTATYTAAMIAADGSPIGVTARVMQVSSTVGNGFPADVALAA